jgi:hypothetical protein
MDPLSIAGSVVSLLQLTGNIIEYLGNVKNAPKECALCRIEASNIQYLLISLQFHLEEGQASGDSWYDTMHALAAPKGPLEQYREALNQLQSKIKIETPTQNIIRRLVWNFTKTEVSQIFSRMERLKSLITLALEKDHL